MGVNYKQKLGDSLSLIIQETGYIQKLHTDNASKMVVRKTQVFKRARKEGIDLTTIEPNHPYENYCENIIGKKKLGDGRIMVRKRVPLQIWCYALEYYCDLSTMIIQE